MIKINNPEYFERTEYVKAEQDFINGLDQEFVEQDSFYDITEFAYMAGLKHNEDFYEDQEYQKRLNRVSVGHPEYTTYDSWYNLINTVFEIGKFDSCQITI